MNQQARREWVAQRAKRLEKDAVANLLKACGSVSVREMRPTIRENARKQAEADLIHTFGEEKP